MRRPSLRRFWYSLQWRTFGNEWKIVTALIVAGLAALVALWPRWTLDYLHVLAWPGVVLIGLLLFRWPLHALLKDTALEEGGFGPLNFRFRQRQGELDLSVALTETTEAVGTLQTQVDSHLYGLEVAGVVLQIFEVQVGFLRHLQSAAVPVTAAAAEAWFEEHTRAAVEAGAPIDVPALVGWLNNRGVIQLNVQGAYETTLKGVHVLGVADDFGYAPKLL